MADLRVEYEALGSAERALGRIVLDLEASEFYRDDLERAWGSRQIADAMRDFVDNWDRHRRTLLCDHRRRHDVRRGMHDLPRVGPRAQRGNG